ncbi:MAG TPA: hypothetical protein VFI47_19600 [Acidimicrobiales bacterium]|nr:hypothetical protein [Acidimicrobiales bacterium]
MASPTRPRPDLPSDPSSDLPSDDPSVADAVATVVRRTVEVLPRVGTLTADGVRDAWEGAGRSLSRRVVAGAEARRGMGSADALARALAGTPQASLVAGGTVAVLALRLARRAERLGFLAKRTPFWLLATAVPALAASVRHGADELGLVAAHLIERARVAGVEPDPERVRRAAVQIVAGVPVDPEREPSHGALVLAWLRRAARAALPFTAGVATAEPQALAATAAGVDPALLGPA